MRSAMNRWTRLAIEHPKKILAVIAAGTLAACLGLPGLHFDASSGQLVPAISGKEGCPANKAREFSDGKNAFFVAVEPCKGIDIFSRAVFSSMGQLISELEEFREFHPETEDARMEKLCRAGRIVTTPVRPARERRAYGYRYYRPLTIAALGYVMDDGGLRQLKSVLKFNGMDGFRNDHLLSREEFGKILETWETLYLFKSMEMMQTLADPLSGLSIAREAGSLGARALAPMDEGRRKIPSGRESFASYRKALFANPSFESSLYSKNDGRVAALGISGEIRHAKGAGVMFDYLHAVIQKYSRPPLSLTLAGPAANSKFIGGYALGDLRALLPCAVLAMMAVIFVATGTVSLALPCGLCVVLALIWTAGGMGHLGIPVSAAGIMVFPLVMAVAGLWSARYALAFARDRAAMRKTGFKFGLADSTGRVFQAVSCSALAMGAAFAAISVNPSAPVSGFGLLALLGAAASFVASTAVMPSVLAIAGERLVHAANSGIASITGWNGLAGNTVHGIFVRLIRAKPLMILLLSLAAAAIFVFGFSRADYTTSPYYYCGRDAAPYLSDLRITGLFGGSSSMSVVADSGLAGGVADPGFLDAVDDIERWISGAYGGTAAVNTFSFVDAVREMHMAANGGDAGSYGVPDNESTIQDYLARYSGKDRDSDGLPDVFEGLVDNEYRRVNIRARVPGGGERIFPSYKGMGGTAALAGYIRDNPQAGKYGWCSSGEAIDYAAVSSAAPGSWTRGTLFAVLAASIVVFFLFKDWRAGAIVFGSLIAVLLFVFGLAGLSGVTLSFPVLAVVCAALAIGLECSIVFAAVIRTGIDEGLALREAVMEAQGRAFREMVPVILAAAAGIFLFTFSGYVPFAVSGWLFCLACLGAYWAVSLLIPSVIIVSSNLTEKYSARG